MDVSIIIVNYHTEKLIADCLRSVGELTVGVDYEVIVVDNAGDETYRKVIEDAVPGMCRYVDMNENVGFGRANNAGAAIARGRNLFFLNPDTILINNAVKILSQYLDSHPEAGACGGNLFDAEMKPALSYRRIFPGIRWELNELFSYFPEKMIYGRNRRFNQNGEPMEVAYITGADLMVRREVFEKVGGFSDEFFMYYEETDLCKRIRRESYRIISVPKAEIKHLEGGSFGKNGISKAKALRISEGRKRYYLRNVTGFRLIISDIIYHTTLKSRILLKRSEICRELLKSEKELSNQL